MHDLSIISFNVFPSKGDLTFLELSGFLSDAFVILADAPVISADATIISKLSYWTLVVCLTDLKASIEEEKIRREINRSNDDDDGDEKEEGEEDGMGVAAFPNILRGMSKKKLESNDDVGAL